MIIDNTYFIGEIYIPHAKPSVTDNVTGVAQDIKYFIDEYTREALIKCLGYKLALEFFKQLDSTQDNGLKVDTDEKWDFLLNGTTYENPDGDEVVWRGIRYKRPSAAEDSTFKYVSFLADYVYWFYEKDNHITRSGSGDQINRSKNASVVLPTDKVVAANRRFIKLVQGEDVTPVVVQTRFGVGVDYYRNGEGQDITLYKFIDDRNTLDETNYPDFNPKTWRRLNVQGI